MAFALEFYNALLAPERLLREEYFNDAACFHCYERKREEAIVVRLRERRERQCLVSPLMVLFQENYRYHRSYGLYRGDEDRAITQWRRRDQRVKHCSQRE